MMMDFSILIEVRVRHDVARGQREQVVLFVYSVRGTHIAVHALVRPEILGGSEKVEAHEVATTMAFPCQLTSTLVDDVLTGDVVVGSQTGTSMHLVVACLAVDAAHATYHLALSQHQIDIGQTEHGEVGVGECIGTVNHGAIGFQIGELCKGISALTVGEELSTLVIGVEFVNELRGQTNTAPSVAAKTIVGRIHVAAHRGTDDIGSTTISLRVDVILVDAEDNLVAHAQHLVIVGTEHLVVVGT